MQRNKRHFSIAIADIDRFKSINDSLGHEQGDEVLRQISNIFKTRSRGQDVLTAGAVKSLCSSLTIRMKLAR